MMSASAEKTVLVHFGERVRPVKLKGTQTFGNSFCLP